ncbi:MAG: hypothetical protein ACLP5V_00745 [Candidatus Bathyarchaeia archaeon]
MAMIVSYAMRCSWSSGRVSHVIVEESLAYLKGYTGVRLSTACEKLLPEADVVIITGFRRRSDRHRRR